MQCIVKEVSNISPFIESAVDLFPFVGTYFPVEELSIHHYLKMKIKWKRKEMGKNDRNCTLFTLE
jgi:hypothetical protein